MFWKRPAVLLIGPVNAGKSTLFNTLGKRGKAIVSRVPGTTRDINMASSHWNKKTFTLLDSAGLDVDVEATIDAQARKAITHAFSSVDIVLFVVDGKLPRSRAFNDISKLYRKYSPQIPWFLVINKIDSANIANNIDPDWYRTNMAGPFFISALKGRGTGDLLDSLVLELEKSKAFQKHKKKSPISEITVSIIGKPNVGKSSLMNVVTECERSLVSPLPHTTRDSQDMTVYYKNHAFTIVDTAGIRKQAKIRQRLRARDNEQIIVENKTVRDSMENIKQSDVVLFVLDISKNITHQDLTLADLITKYQKPVIIIANKWDLIPKDTHTIYEYESYVRKRVLPLPWAPIVFTSALQNIRVHSLFEHILEIYGNYSRKIDFDSLNEFIKKLQKQSLGKNIITLKQTETKPPTFLVSSSKNKLLPTASYPWLEKKLRERFCFIGSPINISSKKIQSTHL